MNFDGETMKRKMKLILILVPMDASNFKSCLTKAEQTYNVIMSLCHGPNRAYPTVEINLGTYLLPKLDQTIFLPLRLWPSLYARKLRL